MEGFGCLAWGSSVDEAMRSCPDLQFKGYRVVDEKEEPFRAYTREHSNNRIGGVPFESVEYWFQGDRFREVHAVSHSFVGPRTLVTEAEHSYDILLRHFRGTYGAPTETIEKYLTTHLMVVKETRWKARRLTILLRYQGADKSGADRLSLEMRKNGGAR